MTPTREEYLRLADELATKAITCRDNAAAEQVVHDLFIAEYMKGISHGDNKPTAETHARTMQLYDFTMGGLHRKANFIKDAELFEASATALRSAASIEPGEGWQTVDTAPDSGEFVLTYSPKHGVEPRLADGAWWRKRGVNSLPTHWMPLPSPPQGTETGS